MSELDLPELELWFRRGRQNQAPVTFRNKVLSKVNSGQGGTKKGARAWSGARPAFVKQPKAYSRRAVIKARIVKMNSKGIRAASLHVKYIEREGVERDGSKGVLYSGHENFDRDELTNFLDKEEHQFRFIISPEDGDELELTAYTKTIMEKMEKDIGRRLIWGAVNHYNTDNPHTHVVVRGICRDGHNLQIHPDYIKNGMRNRAQEIASRELGLRTEQDIAQQRNKEISQERVTSLDREIAKFTTNNEFRFPGADSEKRLWIDRNVVVARLQTLEKIGLAQWQEDMSWRMQEGWEATLKIMGERGDIIKSMYRSVGRDAPGYNIYRNGDVIPEIEGKIVDKGLHDELHDRYYLTIEQTNGQMSYIQLDHNIKHDSLSEGQIIHIKSKKGNWLKPTTDKNIQKIQQENNGLYSRAAHAASIKENTIWIGLRDEQHEHKVGNNQDKGESDIVIIGEGEGEQKPKGKEISKDEFIDSHEQRLNRLASMKLAEKLDDGVWKPVEDFVAKLQKLQLEKPLHHMLINKRSELELAEQVAYKGVTWLDRFTEEGMQNEIAPYGFGAEVRGAILDRMKAVHEMGINPRNQQRFAMLAELERQELGKYLDTRDGTQYQELNVGETIKGRINAVVQSASGKRYVQVLDDLEKRHVLLPYRKTLEGMKDQRISLEQTRQKTIIQSLERKMER